MKYYIFTLLFLSLLLCQPAMSQDVKTITLDLEQPRASENLNIRLKKGDWYQIKLSNVNLNAFRVNVSAADSFFTYAPKSPSFADLPVETIGSLTSELLSGVDFSLFTTSLPESVVQKLKNNVDSPLKEVELKSPDVLLSSSSQVESDLNETLEMYNNLLFTIGDQSIDAVVDGEMDDFLSPYTTIKVNELREKQQLINKEIEDYQLIYRAYLVSNAEALSKEPLKSQIAKLETFNTELIAKQSQLNAALDVKALTRLKLRSRFLDVNNSMEYITLPQRFNGNKATISVSLTPRDSSIQFDAKSTRFMIEQQKNSYFGTGVSFYLSGLSDENYSTLKEVSATDTTFTITSEGESGFEVGISSLFRAGLQKQYDGDVSLGGHLSFGPGISVTDDVRPRILAGVGGSLSSGRHALSVDLGFIGGPVRRKSNAINDGDVFSERPETVTVSVMDSSWFVSLGYMLKF